MRIGIPKEIKLEERRVALTPAGASALSSAGHEVLVETQAGTGSALPDEAYRQAGARITENAAQTWAESDLVLKVKEPPENDSE